MSKPARGVKRGVHNIAFWSNFAFQVDSEFWDLLGTSGFVVPLHLSLMPTLCGLFTQLCGVCLLISVVPFCNCLPNSVVFDQYTIVHDFLFFLFFFLKNIKNGLTVNDASVPVWGHTRGCQASPPGGWVGLP